MEAEHSPQPGQLVGAKYRIVRTLGRGAMGTVFEAQHVATGKRVAVKMLHAHVMQSRSAVERLVREAQASARVRHSNVVDIYDVEREGDALFLVMEYLEGETLAAWLERGGVPMHELLAVIVQAMRGVNEAHRRGIVHRDIKPDNIFLSYEADQPIPIAKVLDFGISKIDSPGGLSLTQTGSALGTPLYMSYEQLSGMRDVDARSDVYGFGVILYEALTGLLPYTADNFAELAAKVITSEPTPPRQIQPEIPERLEEVVLWAMKKRREERAPNLSVLIDALLPFAAPQEGSSSMSSPRLPSPVEGRASAREPKDEVPRLPLSSTPAPYTPALRLDEHKNWDAVLDRSQRERREMEERVTALIAGTMYEGRRKRNQGRGLWMAIGGALAAVVVGVVLATVTRGGDSPAQSGAEPAPKAATEPTRMTNKPEQSGKQPLGSAPPVVAPAAPLEPTAPELMEPAASTQVEPVQMPRFNSATPDAAVRPGAQRASAKPNVRPTFSGPSGGAPSAPPPPMMITPAQPAEPAESPAPFEPPPPPPPPPRDDPSDPVDVNPFEGEPVEPVETYRAGKPREDEF